MRGFCQRPGRRVGARRSTRAAAEWFCLAVVVATVQAVSMSSAAGQHTSVAQHTLSPTGNEYQAEWTATEPEHLGVAEQQCEHRPATDERQAQGQFECHVVILVWLASWIAPLVR